jgi:uncharacterized protein
MLFSLVPLLAAFVLLGQAAQPPSLPRVIPVFPLQETTLFPHATRPLLIFEPRYRAMIADALKGDRIIGMVRLRPGFEAEYEGRPPIDPVGCAGRIRDYELLPDGRYTIVLEGFTRFRVIGEDQGRPYRLARVDAVPEATTADDRFALRTSRERLETLLSAAGIELGDNPGGDEQVVDTVAQYLEMPAGRRQQLLEMDGPLPRARALIDLLTTR